METIYLSEEEVEEQNQIMKKRKMGKM